MREGQSGEYKVENGAELFSSLQMEKKFVKLKGACRKKTNHSVHHSIDISGCFEIENERRDEFFFVKLKDHVGKTNHSNKLHVQN